MSRDDDTYQISCPKCGSFKVEDDSSSGCLLQALQVLLVIITYGVWLIIMFIWRKIKGAPIAKDGQEFRCDNCGYRWKHQ
jgi:predicted RNA-binding Zn-ribbon protein involved in translation (DUF1610 family)